MCAQWFRIVPTVSPPNSWLKMRMVFLYVNAADI